MTCDVPSSNRTDDPESPEVFFGFASASGRHTRFPSGFPAFMRDFDRSDSAWRIPAFRLVSIDALQRVCFAEQLRQFGPDCDVRTFEAFLWTGCDHSPVMPKLNKPLDGGSTSCNISAMERLHRPQDTNYLAKPIADLAVGE